MLRQLNLMKRYRQRELTSKNNPQLLKQQIIWKQTQKKRLATKIRKKHVNSIKKKNGGFLGTKQKYDNIYVDKHKQMRSRWQNDKLEQWVMH